jgi:zinc/manganese transport system substrate-binding protein
MTKSLAAPLAALALFAAIFFASCSPRNTAAPATNDQKTIVVTYSILGSIVQDLAGNQFRVVSLIPNGLDVHEWEPSAKDIETLNHADLVVENGLNLEGGMGKALAQARAAGSKFFTASDYIAVRHVAAGEGIPSGDPDQALGAADPHIWTNPENMKAVIDALAPVLQKDFGSTLADGGSGLASRRQALDKKLDALDAQIRSEVAALPPKSRKLVTGHESLGYFAQHYGFKLIGAVIPSISTEAESSAADLADLDKLIAANRVKVVFTELGTPPATVKALAEQAKVRTVTLITHYLPPDGSYFTFERKLASDIIDSLR